MSVTLKKWLFRILVAVFCGALAWWVFYLPYDANAVLRAIPADVPFVSVHDNLAARWPGVCGSQLLRCLAFSAGIKTQDIDRVASDPETLRWINKLAGRRLAIAYVPSLNGTGREAWLLSSWIGGYSQRLRWMASLGLIPDAKPVGTCGRQRIWAVPMAGVAGNKKLSVAVSDGVLMCCISAVPQGVSTMVEALDGGGRSASGISAERLSQEAAILRECGVSDRGWVAYGDEWPPFSFEVDSLRGADSSGRIRVRDILRGAIVPLKAGELGNLGMFLGDAPEILAVFRARQALQFLGTPGIPDGANVVSNIVGTCVGDKPDRRMFVCLFGGKYRARMKSVMPEGLGDLLGGIPVPVIMCGIEADDAGSGRRTAAMLLDRLNAEYRLGIIARPIPVGDETVMSVEGTGPGDYSKLAAEERVAYTVCGRWLILSSNVEVLSKLVARYQGDQAKKEAFSSRWLKGLGKEDAAAVYAWSNLDAAGVTLSDSLALWKFSMEGDRSPQGRRLRRTLNILTDWMDAVRPLQCGYVAAHLDGEITELHFVQGSQSRDN